MRDLAAVALGFRSNSKLTAKFFVPPLKSGAPGSGLCRCNVGRAEGLRTRCPTNEATRSKARITRRSFHQFSTKLDQPPAVGVVGGDDAGKALGDEVMTPISFAGVSDADGDTVGDTSAVGLVDRYGVSMGLGDEDRSVGDGLGGHSVGLIVGDGDED